MVTVEQIVKISRIMRLVVHNELFEHFPGAVRLATA